MPGHSLCFSNLLGGSLNDSLAGSENARAFCVQRMPGHSVCIECPGIMYIKYNISIEESLRSFGSFPIRIGYERLYPIRTGNERSGNERRFQRTGFKEQVSK